MEYYLNEDDPVDNTWLKDNLGWLEEEKNKILNISLIEGIDINYPGFKQVIHLPNNKDSIINQDRDGLMTIFNKFLEECTDNLEYCLSTNVDNKNMIVNIFLLPIVESA